jgi:hypothetical protein
VKMHNMVTVKTDNEVTKIFFFIILFIIRRNLYCTRQAGPCPQKPGRLKFSLIMYPRLTINANEEKFILTIFFEKTIFFSFIRFKLIFNDLKNA